MWALSYGKEEKRETIRAGGIFIVFAYFSLNMESSLVLCKRPILI